MVGLIKMKVTEDKVKEIILEVETETWKRFETFEEESESALDMFLSHFHYNRFLRQVFTEKIFKMQEEIDNLVMDDIIDENL